MGVGIVILINIIAFSISYINCFKFNKALSIYLICFNIVLNTLYNILYKKWKVFLYIGMFCIPIGILANYAILWDTVPFIAHHIHNLINLSLLIFIVFMLYDLIKKR